MVIIMTGLCLLLLLLLLEVFLSLSPSVLFCSALLCSVSVYRPTNDRPD